MTGFVRAVAVSQESVLNRSAHGVDRAIEAVDEIRRRGTHVILVTEETIEHLAGPGTDLLPHFDAVVAESGAILRVGPGPDRAMAGQISRRTGFLAALRELGVDPHDSLAISGDSRDVDLLDASEVSVAVGGADPTLWRSADISLRHPAEDALERLLDDVLSAGPTSSPGRHDVRLGTQGEDAEAAGGELVVPGAHANVVLCAPSLPRPDVPRRLLAEWVAAGYQCLVVDPFGRYWGGGAEEGLPRATRIGYGGSSGGQEFEDDVGQRVSGLLDAAERIVILDMSALKARDRSLAVTETLLAVQRERARVGRPHWLVIDDAEVVLSDPDLPPEALRLSARGHCLILRAHERPPASLAGVVDVVLPAVRS